MRFQLVERALGGRQRLDVEALEQRARPEFRLFETARRCDRRPCRRWRLLSRSRKSQHFREGMVEPQPGRRAAEQMKILRETPPDPARVASRLRRRRASARRSFRGDALAVEHAVHVVVGHDEKPSRIRERLVVGEPLRVGMAMRADDRQVGDRPVKLARDRPRRRIRRKQPIRMELKRLAPWRDLPKMPSGQSVKTIYWSSG